MRRIFWERGATVAQIVNRSASLLIREKLGVESGLGLVHAVVADRQVYNYFTFNL
jgi:hypothetical protein